MSFSSTRRINCERNRGGVISSLKRSSSDLAKIFPRLGELTTIQLKHPICVTYRRNDRSYLLHRPCTKTHLHGQDVVLVKQQLPISSITVFENYLHVNHAPPRTTRVAISFTTRFFLQDATQHGNNLRPKYKVTLFRYVQHHGITRKPRLELSSHLANAYNVTLGVSLLPAIHPSPRNFVRFFVHPSQVTICNSKYIYSFLPIVISYDLLFSVVHPS